MQLWYTRCPLPTASGVAIERGMLDWAFEGEGIRVQSLNASGDMAVRGAHYDHGQANLFRQGGNIPPIWSRARGADTVVVATGWIDEYQALVAVEGSGIAAPSDLRGRRFGIPRRRHEKVDYWAAMCLRGCLAGLAGAGLGAEDAEFVDLPVEEGQIASGGASQRGILFRGGPRARRQSREAMALIRGEVDVIYTAGAPGAHLTAFMDARVVVDLTALGAATPVNNQVPSVLTVDGALARSRPEVVGRYLATLMQASQWARTHPEETLAVVGADVGATAEWVTAAYGPDLHTRLDVDLDGRSVAAVGLQKAFLVEQGFVDADFDLADWIDAAPLSIAHEMLR